MTAAQPPVRIFIGSSREGQEVALNLQAELESRIDHCEVDLWRTIFEPSGYTLPSLLQAAANVDFAVLVATPDDMTHSRGQEKVSARDNVILEFGLFCGALGLERTYLLATDDVQLPSDLFGLTRLPYKARTDGNLRSAVNGAVLDLRKQVDRHGRLVRQAASVTYPDVIDGGTASSPFEHRAGIEETSAAPPGDEQTMATPSASRSHTEALEAELDVLASNLAAQGWQVRTNSQTTFRVQSGKGKVYTFAKRQPDLTRSQLREFAATLKGDGLRVNGALLGPPEESPF